MKIENIKTELIKPYWRNAKKHPKKQVEQIANSIKMFGFNQPLVLDRNNVIIVGHGRYEASIQLGMLEVPAIYADLTADKIQAYRLADNKLNESDWIMDSVLAELKEIPTDLVELTGFSLDLLVEEDDMDDVIPNQPEPKSQRGDKYQLGKHTLLCGDATLKEDLINLIGDKTMDMIFTDPPYNVNYSGRGKSTSNKIENDDMSPEEFDIFLDKVFKNYRMAVKGGGSCLCVPLELLPTFIPTSNGKK